MSDIAFETSWRRLQDKGHRHIADAIYREIFGDVKIIRVDEATIGYAESKALDILGVDFHVCFANQTRLSGQEKYLSFSERGFRTVTVSEHSWKHCAAQIYFVGYLTENGQGFDPWVIMNWPAVMLATARREIAWGFRRSRGPYASFWFASMDILPPSCLIASSL